MNVGLLLGSLLLSVTACGQTASDVNTDGGWLADASADGPSLVAPDAAPLGDAAVDPAFCSGSSAKMVLNGSASNPAPTGSVAVLNCCDEAEITFVTQTSSDTVTFEWRSMSAPTTLPATIDLAHPPPGWDVGVYVNCDPAKTGCPSAPDSYTKGLQGTLQVLRAGAGYDMSLCLATAEGAGSPHPIVHALKLYAAHVTAM